MASNSKRRLDEAGYGAGALASGSFATVPGLILLFYMTDTLAISAAVAGFVVLMPKLFDVFLNPVVGRLSDRTRSRFGARRPWILFGGVLFPLAFIAMFWTPMSGNGAAIWVAVTFTIASLSFSGFVVPWSSLPAEIAPDTRARTTMAAWRIAFLAIAILLSGGLAPTIVENAGDARSGYRQMALTMGGIMIAAAFVVVLIGARRSTQATTRPAAAAGFRASYTMLRTSAPLRAMFWLVCLTEIASAVSLASTPYIANYILGDAGAVAPMFIILTIPLLVTMPLWRGLAVRHGKSPALCTALVIFALGALVLASLSIVPDDMRLATAYTAALITGIGFAGTSMLPQAMFSDALAYETAMRDESNTGAMVGVWNAAETISGGVGAAAFALALSLSGFISAPESETVVQSGNAITAIVLAAGLIPAVAALIALWPARAFSLSEDDVDAATRRAI
jgi:GPH family glycoside/pentoside/hexuronide:cation symporter